MVKKNVLRLFWANLVIILVVMTSFTAYAQKSIKDQIDSIDKILPSLKNDTNKIKALEAQAKVYPLYDPNKGLTASQQALVISMELGWDKGIMKAYYYKGLNENSSTRYDSSLKSFGAALDRARSLKDEVFEGLALIQTGYTYYTINNSPLALKYLFEALGLEERRHNREQICTILEYVGRVYEFQLNYDKALMYYKMSYDTALAVGERKATAKNLMNIGQVYMLMNKDAEAIQCFEQSLAAFKVLRDQGGIAISLANLGALAAKGHRYGAALAMQHEGLAIYEGFSDLFNIASISSAIGHTYLLLLQDTSHSALPDSLNDRKKVNALAYEYIKKGMKMARELSIDDGYSSSAQDLSLLEELNGNYKEALLAYKEYAKIKDSVYSAENNVKIANLEINKEVKEKDDQLKLEQLKVAKKRNENIYFATGAVLLLIITLILLRNYNTQRQLNATITQLVSEQEKTIAQRTKALMVTNEKLLDLVQFNVHNLREPMTRIMGLLAIQKEVSNEEFINTCLPMIEQSVTDLDDRLKEVIIKTEETKSDDHHEGSTGR